MSIKATQISKHFGQQKALDTVSFTVNSGEITGFLGPNGAGKSTMMKILTGFLPPTSGTAEICGFNIDTHPLEVKKRIGYLPEHNPLYLDMYVREYLEFSVQLFSNKNIKIKETVKEVIEKTGLGPEQHKQIGALSKGYRQRVGLAQAIIHNPEVLILDEPTTGLDPNQLVDIRNLIKELGKNKTVLFSTHIMQEVEAICSRVIIINQGKIVADNTLDKVQSLVSKTTVITVEFDKPVSTNQLKKLEGVLRVKEFHKHTYVIESMETIDIRPLVFQFAVSNQLTVLSLTRNEKSLEETFHLLTTN